MRLVGPWLAVVLCAVPMRAWACDPAAPGAASIMAAIEESGLPAGLGLRCVEPPRLRAGERIAARSVRWSGPARIGWGSVAVRIERRGAHRDAWARVELRPMCRVLVARRALETGATVGVGDVASELRAVEPGTVLSVDEPQARGRLVRRALEQGEILGREDLITPPPLPAGSEVAVVVRRGLVRVVARGVLDRPGRVGEATPVRLLADRRVVAGRLEDAHTVTLEGL